jgi:hypothetical protein
MQEPVQLCRTLDPYKWKKAIFWVFDAPEIAHQPYEVCYLQTVHKLTNFILGKSKVFKRLKR